MKNSTEQRTQVSVLEAQAQALFESYDWGGEILERVSCWTGDAMGGRWTRGLVLKGVAGAPITAMFLVLFRPLDIARVQVVAAIATDQPRLVGVPKVFDSAGLPIPWLRRGESAHVALKVGHTSMTSSSDRPSLALMKCTAKSLGRLLRMWMAVNVLRGSELRSVDAPVWWPLAVEEEMRLDFHEVVVSAAGEIRFVGVPGHQQYLVETAGVELQKLFDLASRHVGGMGIMPGMSEIELREADEARAAILGDQVFFVES